MTLANSRTKTFQTNLFLSSTMFISIIMRGKMEKNDEINYFIYILGQCPLLDFGLWGVVFETPLPRNNTL